MYLLHEYSITLFYKYFKAFMQFFNNKQNKIFLYKFIKQITLQCTTLCTNRVNQYNIKKMIFRLIFGKIYLFLKKDYNKIEIYFYKILSFTALIYKNRLVCLAGIEPATFPLGGGRSILLSYKHVS